MKSKIDGVDIGIEADISLPPGFEVYAKNQKQEKYDLMLPDRIGMNNPKKNPSFESHMLDFQELRMNRIEKRSLNIPDEEEFENIEMQLNMKKQEAEVMAQKNEELMRRRQELKNASFQQG